MYGKYNAAAAARADYGGGVSCWYVGQHSPTHTYIDRITRLAALLCNGFILRHKRPDTRELRSYICTPSAPRTNTPESKSSTGHRHT